jgi:hypothetical protein
VTATYGIAAADAEAIRALIVEFHYLVDHGRASECLGLLAPTAKLIFGPGTPNPGTIEGLEAIETFLRTREKAPIKTRHLLGQTRFTAEDANNVVTTTLLTLFRSPGSEDPNVPAAIADLVERYVRTDAGWRLSVREVQSVLWD